MGAGVRVLRHRHRVDVVEIRNLVVRVEQVDPERDLIAGALLSLGEEVRSGQVRSGQARSGQVMVMVIAKCRSCSKPKQVKSRGAFVWSTDVHEGRKSGKHRKCD